ncbi:MAG: universal stress protein [Halofilum sp. (in: g-proteobacteria)]|nr:universal stress protein [Halofilum sp. (in: g-proteobacteria)]
MACELARRYGAKLHIVHSEDVEDVDAIDALGGATIPTEYRRSDVEIEASKRLKQLEKDHASELEGVKYETKLSREEAGRALIAYCERNSSDLLVVGRAGHSPLVANVLGSAVNRVIHGSPTTLVICPAK